MYTALFISQLFVHEKKNYIEMTILFLFDILLVSACHFISQSIRLLCTVGKCNCFSIIFYFMCFGRLKIYQKVIALGVFLLYPL